MFGDPESVLADVQGFWEREEPLRYATGWHGVVGVPVDLDRFRTVVAEIRALSMDQREAHPALLMTRRVLGQEKRFIDEGIPHVCMYLPDRPARLDIRVLFAGGLRANAFVYEHAVVDATSPHWHAESRSIDERASSVLNLLAHECWHGGFCENRERWSETPHDDTTLYRLLVNIQDEGVATYVNYTARSLFPAPGDSDFAMLGDPAQLVARFEATRAILNQRHTLDEPILRDLVWREGVLGRAFYITGAHMARVIEQRSGRDALTETIATGPLSFFAAYNRVADAPLRVSLSA
jgi:hypothetical protein